MQSINFAMPTLSTAQMTRQDQIDIAVKATAAIVCCYLEHMNAAIQGAAPAVPLTTSFLSTAELPGLINSVQGALRVIP